MSWVLLALFAAAVWALGSILDKIVLSKFKVQPAAYLVITGFLGFLLACGIFFFHGFSVSSAALPALAAGVFYAACMLVYFKAVKMEEISRVTPLFSLTPLFVLVLAAVFLGEVFTFWKYVGILLLIAGALAISINKSLRLNKAFWLMLVSDFGFSLYLVLSKYALAFTDYWILFIWVRLGILLVITPLALKNWREVIKPFKNVKAMAAISLAATAGFIGLLALYAAMAQGPVTLADALTSTESLFVLLFTVLLSVFWPRALKEEVGFKIVASKLIAIAMMIIGAFLVS